MSAEELINLFQKNFERLIDRLADYAENFFSAFGGALVQTYLYCFALYIFFLAMRILIGQSDMPIGELFKKLAIGAIIYAIGVEWSTIFGPFYETITSPEWANVLFEASGLGRLEPDDTLVAYLLKQIGAQIELIWLSIAESVGFDFKFVVYALCGLFFTIPAIIFICIIAILYFSVIFLLAVAFGLAPIFVIGLFFEATKGFFFAWLRTVLGLALIPVAFSLVLTLTNRIYMQFGYYTALAIHQEDSIGLAFLATAFAAFGFIFTAALIKAIPNFISGMVGASSIGETAANIGMIGQAVYARGRGAVNWVDNSTIRNLQKNQINANKQKAQFYKQARKNL